MPGSKIAKKRFFSKRKPSAKLKRVIDKEIKKKEQIDHEVKEYVYNTGASFADLNYNTNNIWGVTAGPVQGATSVTRIGDKIYMKELWVRVYLQMPNYDGAHLTDTKTAVRVIVFQWFPNTTWRMPIVSDILNVSGTGGTAQNFTAPYNHDQSADYHIMKDKVYSLLLNSSAGLTDSNSNKCIFMKFKRIRRRALEFQPAGDASHGINQIFVLFLSNSTTATGNNQVCQMVMTTQLLFTDS